MSTAIIELNDSELRLASGGDILLRQPGYAVLKADTIHTGEQAWRLARSHPRLTYNRYWSQLNQDSLIVPSHLARHHADIAYAQLLALHEQAGRPEEVVFAVPGSYTREQLAMLLGIVKSCPFTAVGLVDAATASVSAIAGAGNYTHVDIHLHYAVITSFEVSDTVTRNAVRIVNDAGIAGIYESGAAHISDLFIDQSRFDPLHHGETEQQLYDRLPSALRELQQGDELTLEIDYKGKRYQARVFREPLLERLKQHYERIYREIAGQGTRLVSDRLHALPGFSEHLGNAVPLDELSVFRGCNINLLNIRSAGPSVSFITSLPAAPEPVLASGAAAVPAGPAGNTGSASTATHVLINHRACPLGSAPLYLAASGAIVNAEDQDNRHCSIRQTARGIEIRPEGELTVFVNGTRLSSPRIVNTGDTVSFAGVDTTARLIEVITH